MIEPLAEKSSLQLDRKPKAILIAYLGHLVVPLFLTLDVVLARRLGYIELQFKQSHTVVLILSAVWLTLGLGVLALSRGRRSFYQRVKRPLAGIYAIYFSLILAEVFTRIVLGLAPTTPTLWPPNTKWVTHIDSGAFPGIHLGVKLFTVNEVGLRGPSLPGQSNAYKIITIGGSTTECAVLDDSEEWPHLLMQEINSRQRTYPVWVANAGVSGHTTVHHLVLLRSLSITRKVDMLIFLTGVNDLGASLASDGAPNRISLEVEAQRFRDYLLAGGFYRYRFPLYKRLRLLQLGRQASVALAQKFRPLASPERVDLPLARKRRAAAPVVPLPDLQTGLKDYGEHVLELARECQFLGARCLFLTQPSLWRNELTPQEQQLLWWGYVGPWKNPKGYVSAAWLALGMELYNRELLDVCQRHGLECYDIASFVPKNTSVFYDDEHFNEGGARIMAKLLADYLLSREPFEEARDSTLAREPRARATGGIEQTK